MTISFKVQRTDKSFVLGFLSEEKGSYKLIFSNEVFNETIHPIAQSDIKNPEILIASYLANSAKAKKSDEKFTYLEIDNVKTIIKYGTKEVDASKKRSKYYIYKDNWIKSGQSVELETDLGKITLNVKELGLEEIEVPNDFKYSKNDFINTLLKNIKAPWNVDRALVNAISKDAEKIKESVYKNEIIYMYKKTFKLTKRKPLKVEDYYSLHI